MSVRLMSKIWEHAVDVRSDRLIVLLALADWAGDDGHCWPNMNTLAAKARTTRDGASRIVAWLENEGYLTVKRGGGRGRQSDYIVHPIKIKNHPAEPACQTSPQPCHAERSRSIPPNPNAQTAMPTAPNSDPQPQTAMPGGIKGDAPPNGTSRYAHAEPPVQSPMEPSCTPPGASSKNAEWSKITPLAETQKLADVCGIDLQWGTVKQRWEILHEFDALIAMGMTAGLLDAFLEWWRRHDWRGQKGNLPRPVQVRETWKQFERFLKEGDHATPPLPTRQQHDSDVLRQFIKNKRERLAAGQPV